MEASTILLWIVGSLLVTCLCGIFIFYIKNPEEKDLTFLFVWLVVLVCSIPFWVALAIKYPPIPVFLWSSLIFFILGCIFLICIVVYGYMKNFSNVSSDPVDINLMLATIFATFKTVAFLFVAFTIWISRLILQDVNTHSVMFEVSFLMALLGLPMFFLALSLDDDGNRENVGFTAIYLVGLSILIALIACNVLVAPIILHNGMSYSRLFVVAISLSIAALAILPFHSGVAGLVFAASLLCFGVAVSLCSYQELVIKLDLVPVSEWFYWLSINLGFCAFFLLLLGLVDFDREQWKIKQLRFKGSHTVLNKVGLGLGILAIFSLCTGFYLRIPGVHSLTNNLPIILVQASFACLSLSCMMFIVAVAQTSDQMGVKANKVKAVALGALLLLSLALSVLMLGKLLLVLLPELVKFNLAAGFLAFQFGVIIWIFKDVDVAWANKDTSITFLLLSWFLFMLASLMWRSETTLIFLLLVGMLFAVAFVSNDIRYILRDSQEKIDDIFQDDVILENVYQALDPYKAVTCFCAQTVLFFIYISSLAETRDLETVNVVFFYLGIVMVPPFSTIVLSSSGKELKFWQLKRQVHEYVREEMEKGKFSFCSKYEGNGEKPVKAAGAKSFFSSFVIKLPYMSLNSKSEGDPSNQENSNSTPTDRSKNMEGFRHFMGRVQALSEIFPYLVASLLVNRVYGVYLVVSLPLMLSMCESPMEFVLNSMAIAFVVQLDDTEVQKTVVRMVVEVMLIKLEKIAKDQNSTIEHLLEWCEKQLSTNVKKARRPSKKQNFFQVVQAKQDKKNARDIEIKRDEEKLENLLLELRSACVPEDKEQNSNDT